MPLDTTTSNASLASPFPNCLNTNSSSNSSKKTNLLSLPDELLLNILSYLDPSDHATTLLLNRRLHALTIDPTLFQTRRATAHAVLARFRRPPATALAARNILYTPARLAPTSDPANTRLLLALQRRLHSERLAHALRRRPSRTELVQRHILVDTPAGGAAAGPCTARLVLKLERKRIESTLETWFSVWLDSKSPRRVVVPSSYSVARRPAAGRRVSRARSRSRSPHPRQQQQFESNNVITLNRQLFDNTNRTPSRSRHNPSSSSNSSDSSSSSSWSRNHGGTTEEEDYFLKRPVSALVHMFTCTAMWLSGPPPPRPPPLPLSGSLPSHCDWQMQMQLNPPRKVVSQMCSVFETPASQSYPLSNHQEQQLFPATASSSTDNDSVRKTIQSQYLLDGRVKSLKQLFIS
jgi:hypothetical protein